MSPPLLTGQPTARPSRPSTPRVLLPVCGFLSAPLVMMIMTMETREDRRRRRRPGNFIMCAATDPHVALATWGHFIHCDGDAIMMIIDSQENPVQHSPLRDGIELAVPRHPIYLTQANSSALLVNPLQCHLGSQLKTHVPAAPVLDGRWGWLW